MRIGNLTIDSIIDGEVHQPVEFSYPGVPADQHGLAQPFVDRATGHLVNTIGSHLVRGDGRVVLFDAGIGPRPTVPFSGGALRSALVHHGVQPDDVTDVIFTHLHVDHIGWATQDGQPFFRNAVYRADRRDWDFFLDENYDTPDWEKVATNVETDAAPVRLGPLADRMEFWEGDAQILPGISSIDAAGHTAGTDAFVLTSGTERGVLLGDIVHSQPEILYGWEYALHADPAAAVESVRKLREYIVADDLPFSAAHFTGMTWGRIVDPDGANRWAQER